MIGPHHGKNPEIHPSVFVAPSADIFGDVKIGKDSSVWFQVVIRGDVNWIEIGDRSNVQDHSMLHVTRKIAPLKIGNDVTVGHRATLHGCTIGDRVLIGMGAIVMDFAEIGDDCVIGAGALVTQKKKIPPRSLVMGSPAKVVRPLEQEEIDYLKEHAGNYVQDGREFKEIISEMNP